MLTLKNYYDILLLHLVLCLEMLSVPLIGNAFLYQQEEQMGFGKEFKKATQQIGHALSDPMNAVNMMYSVYALDKNIENHQARVKTETKMQEDAAQQAAINAADRNFQNDLDRKRKVSKRTNVIFAGLLGDNDEIGLGGQKNLLGL